jgi:membrane fusion protein, multidrug efflux system
MNGDGQCGRAVLALCIVHCAFLPVLWGCGRESVEEVETSTPVPVVVQAAVVKTIQGTVAATAVVTPAPGADLVVTAPEAARIAEIPRAEGERVRQGDLLVRFDIPTVTAAVRQRSAEVTQATARVEQARSSAERLAGLLDRGVAARKDVEDARRELADAEGALAQAESASTAASSLAARAIVRAPFAGVVAKRWHNAGAIVEPGAADPILRVIDPSRLEALAAVPVTDLPRMTRGNRARVLVPDGQVEDALVASLPAAVDPGSATANVRLTFRGHTRLTAGMPVRVEIAAEEHANVVVVPGAAIVREGDAAIAVVAGADQKAHRKPVTLGLASGADVEIRSGLSAGDRVIVKGQDALPDGAAIAVAP